MQQICRKGGTQMERIELIHVNKKLGGKEVLKGVDLTLE